jgi:hypothetical protein
MEPILFRSSAVHHIMTDPKSKSEEISEGCKTHLIDVYVSKKYGRNTEINTKYTNKGLFCEDDSITLYSRVKKQFFKKNEIWLTNDHVSGTPDLYTGESINTATRIIDIKSSFDIYTFFRSKFKPLNKEYYWQLQSYMMLTGAKTSTLAYCLVNTPSNILEDEKRKLWYGMGGNNGNVDQELYSEACEKLAILHTYDDIPMKDRVHEIEIPRNDVDIEKIRVRVEECRKYMKEKFNFPESLNIAA